MSREAGIGGMEGEAGRPNLPVSCLNKWRLPGETSPGEAREDHPGDLEEDLVRGMVLLLQEGEDSGALRLHPLHLEDLEVSFLPGAALRLATQEEAMVKEHLLAS